MFITFLPVYKQIQVELGTNLLQAARENGIHLGGVCSGQGYCGKCKVLVTKGNLKNFGREELTYLTQEERANGIRLACCFCVTQDTCVIIQGESDSKGTEDNSSLTPSEPVSQSSRLVDPYGIVFDIGTTTVVGELWNLAKKEKSIQCSKHNPQSLFGADVISRITYANSSIDNRNRLTGLVRTCCNDVISELTTSVGLRRFDVTTMVICGNTTMSHLFLGKSVDSLMRVPFQGISYDKEVWKAADLHLDIKSDAEVYIMPGISGHVGSDTLGCIVSTKLASTKGTLLMVDIGTNGELVLAKDGKLMTCSTAAGPAFEGASLHQGMRADDGAISKVIINQDKIELDYIGSDKPGVFPRGICGSGLIEAVSELLTNQWIDETGRLLGEAGIKNQVTLWKSAESQVILTQKDIRELQLAKGAIYAGIQLMLREMQITMNEIDKIYLAGAFGSNVNLKKAISIGLLPDIDVNRIEYIGNGALAGASMLLLEEVSKMEAEAISRNISHLELAQCEEFSEEFMKALSFPQK